MTFTSVKAIGYFQQGYLDTANKNAQPIEKPVGFYKVSFGDGTSGVMNMEGDSFKRTAGMPKNTPLETAPQKSSFGDKFAAAALELKGKLRGKQDTMAAASLGAELGTKMYGGDSN